MLVNEKVLFCIINYIHYIIKGMVKHILISQRKVVYGIREIINGKMYISIVAVVLEEQHLDLVHINRAPFNEKKNTK